MKVCERRPDRDIEYYEVTSIPEEFNDIGLTFEILDDCIADYFQRRVEPETLILSSESRSSHERDFGTAESPVMRFNSGTDDDHAIRVEYWYHLDQDRTETLIEDVSLMVEEATNFNSEYFMIRLKMLVGDKKYRCEWWNPNDLWNIIKGGPETIEEFTETRWFDGPDPWLEKWS